MDHGQPGHTDGDARIALSGHSELGISALKNSALAAEVAATTLQH